jgi:hypothetical protein
MPDSVYDEIAKSMQKYLDDNGYIIKDKDLLGEKKYCLLPACATSRFPRHKPCSNKACFDNLEFNEDGTVKSLKPNSNCIVKKKGVLEFLREASANISKATKSLLNSRFGFRNQEKAAVAQGEHTLGQQTHASGEQGEHTLGQQTHASGEQGELETDQQRKHASGDSESESWKGPRELPESVVKYIIISAIILVVAVFAIIVLTRMIKLRKRKK